jgi:hypothetical protein
LHGIIEGGIVLPVFSVRLIRRIKNNLHQFSWTIEADEPVIQQSLEISNGTAFNAITDVPVNEKSYFDETMNAGQYRLKVVFADGHIHYSNMILVAHNEVVHKPKFLSNPINSGTLYVNSPGNYDYTLIDLTGKMIRNGKIVSGINDIDITNVMPGVYIMRYYGNNGQWTDKILRQ